MNNELFEKLIKDIKDNKITHIKDNLFPKRPPQIFTQDQIITFFDHLKNNSSITHIQFRKLLPLTVFALGLLNDTTNTNIVGLDISRNELNYNTLQLVINILSRNQIEILDISTCNIGRSYIICPLLASIANNIKLKALGVSNNNINFTETVTVLFYNIIAADKLTFLNLSSNNTQNFSTQNFIQNIGLNKNNALRELILKNINMDHKALSYVFSSITNSRIARINLQNNPKLCNVESEKIPKQFLSSSNPLITIIDVDKKFASKETMDEIYQLNKLINVNTIETINSIGSYTNPGDIIQGHSNGKNLLRIFNILKESTMSSKQLPYQIIQPLQYRKENIRYLFEKEIKVNSEFRESLKELLKDISFEKFFNHAIECINNRFLFKSTIYKRFARHLSSLPVDIENLIGYFVNGNIKFSFPKMSLKYIVSSDDCNSAAFIKGRRDLSIGVITEDKKKDSNVSRKDSLYHIGVDNTNDHRYRSLPIKSAETCIKNKHYKQKNWLDRLQNEEHTEAEKENIPCKKKRSYKEIVTDNHECNSSAENTHKIRKLHSNNH